MDQAEQMTAEEQNELSRKYYWGDGVEIDLQRSAYYCEKAALAGNADAMYNMGVCCREGIGTSQDFEKGLYWFDKAADAGYVLALVNLGDMYYQGQGVEKDLMKSLYYFERGAELGDPYAMINAARQYEHAEGVGKDEKKAKELYECAYEILREWAIEDNDKEAQFWLGNLFFLEHPQLDMDIKQDYVQAFEWYLKSANNNHPFAQVSVGLCYQFGLGTQVDYSKAVGMYEKSAEKNNAMALCYLGYMYLWGYGVEKDERKAADFFSKSAHLDFAEAQNYLGELYLYGKGVEKNYIQAIFWTRKAHERGIDGATDNLAKCYMEGLGVEKDEKTAYKLYCEAAEKGNTHSRISLAECYIEGLGVEINYQKAFQILKDVCAEENYYRKEAITFVVDWNYIENPLHEESIQFYAKAYYLLAVLFYSGLGTERNPNEAIRLLRIAEKTIDKNNVLSKEKIQSLIGKILSETDESKVEDAVKCYIEVRDLGNWKKGQMCRYAFTIHHADGSSSDIQFRTKRCKFVYLLSILFAYNSQTAGLMARYFALGRDLLADLARDAEFDIDGQGTWIDEYIYKETFVEGAKRYQYEYCNSTYSNAVSQANILLRESCVSEEEYKTFCIRKTGGRESIAFISIANHQIMLPPSLIKYSELLPNKETLLHYRCSQVRPIDYGEYIQKRKGMKKTLLWE